ATSNVSTRGANDTAPSTPDHGDVVQKRTGRAARTWDTLARMEWINTVTGRARPEELGMTLVHEHLLLGYPGWYMDGLAPKHKRADALAKAVDRMAELRSRGVSTFLDPCPMD